MKLKIHKWLFSDLSDMWLVVAIILKIKINLLTMIPFNYQ